MTGFYLSFCDPDRPRGAQFLGGLYLKADSFIEAVQISHRLGLNPGGEVKGFEFELSAAPVGVEYGRLLSREEVEAS